MINTFVSVVSECCTVADVRRWLEEVESLQISDDTSIDVPTYLAVDVSDLRVEFIDCGEHIPTGNGYSLPRDLLVYLHDCRTDHPHIEGKPE